MNKLRSIAFDSVSVRTIDKNGFLHVARSPLTRVQVAPYLGKEIANFESLGLEPEKIYYAYRPAEELEKAETIQSINGIPIHLQHHDDYGDPEDKLTRIGTTGTDGAFDYPFLMNSLHIHDKDAIKRIEDGSMKELSLAYSYIADFTAGETSEGEKYDYIQRQIRANHLALVENGRAGPEVKVRDSREVLNKMDPTDTKNDAIERAETALAQAIVDLHKPDENGNVTDIQDNDVTETTQEETMEEQVKDDDVELDERMKDPTFKEGFEAGVRYGEKREKADPKRIDEDHEREGEERYLDKLADDALKACGLDEAPDDVKKAFKAGLNYSSANDKDDEVPAPAPEVEETEDDGEEVEEEKEEVKEEVKASDSLKVVRKAICAEVQAIADVRPVLGSVRLGAYDSAGAVYVAALNKLGLKGIAPRAARSAYFAYMHGRKSSVGTRSSFAKDSAPRKSTYLDSLLDKIHD